jgi:uncharacterized protein YndB with AHSA1/START domain
MPDARRSSNRTVSEVRSELELVITRTIDGPARIVYDAWTKLELLNRWWAPKMAGVAGEGMVSDVRTGGSFRHVLKLHSGGQISFRGTYLEVDPPRRLVYTSIFEPRPEAGEVLCTVTFEELDGKTKIVLHEKFPSKEALQAALKSGMDASLDQLEELVATLSSSA